MKTKIIELIQKNRISSTQVADALGKTGSIPNLQPVNSGQFKVGEIKYLFTFSGSNWPLHEQIENVTEEKFLFIDCIDCADLAIFGDLVSKYLFLYKRSIGAIVLGKMRDIPDLIKYNYPIWCYGTNPIGCVNKNVKLTFEQESFFIKRKLEFEGGIAVADDTGCTIIRNDQINSETLLRLENIELQEDIWAYCINTLKWSTYRTICMKDYLNYLDLLPPAFRENIQSIDFKK
jgi:4-hydroxy-4-methyl-2-oxoglutarate aldolase